MGANLNDAVHWRTPAAQDPGIKKEIQVNLTVAQQPKNAYDRYLLSASVDTALARGLEIDPYNLKFRTLPEKAEATLSRPVNVKGRPFSWSYSALADFEGCAKRYAEDKFYKRLPWLESEAAIWGNRVHDAGDFFVKGQPITDPEAFKEVAKYAEYFKSLKDAGKAEVPTEMEIVLGENMQPLTTKDAWFSKKAWLRVKIDVPVIQGKKAGIYDYKTGKRNSRFPPSDDQLKICAAALSIVRPEIEVFIPKLIWTRDQETSGIQGETIHKDDIPNIWAGILQRVRRMEDAWRSEVWNAKPSGLCGWCGIKDTCEYRR